MRKLLSLAAFLMVLVACSPPPFDLDLSLSVRAVQKLTSQGTLGPFDTSSGSQAPVSATFYPQNLPGAGLSVAAGFLVTDQGAGQNVAFASLAAAAAKYHVLGNTLNLPPPRDPHYPVLLPHALKDATLYRVGGFVFTPGDSAAPTYYEVRADPAIGTMGQFYSHQPDFDLPPLFGFSGSIIGVSVIPSAATDDTAYFLARDGVTGKYIEFSMTLGVGTLQFAGATRGAALYDLSWVGFPTSVTRAQYFYDPTSSRSYLSWFDPSSGQGAWRCWAWSGTGAGNGGELAGVSHRIDALLTTGELFSADPDTGRVYGPDGTLRESFPLTGLTFVDERFMNGVATMLFSQLLYFQQQPWFALYSVPTGGLAALGQ